MVSGVHLFKLPDVGEGLTEAEIVKWHVAVGDTVEVNQTIVEIETAKAIVELPCPFDGVVSELFAAEGATVDVGEPIIAVADPGSADVPAAGAPAPEAAAPAPDAPGPEVAEPSTPEPEPLPAQPADLKEDLVPQPPPEEPKRQPVLVGYGVKPGATKRRPRKAGHARPQPVDGRAATRAKPPVRKMARDLGVDLTTLTGSGPDGTITRDDVRAALEAPAAPAAREGERIPVKGVRKAMASAMVESAFTAPHVTEFLQVDVTPTMEAVARLRTSPDFADAKVSPLLFVAKALIAAARRHPRANATWDGDAIVVHPSVNLGIAAATERGLLVPNVKDAQTLSLPDLARALTALAETARAGKSTPASLTGGTITITNIGVFGIDAGTPILTPGEAAILAFGRIRDMPWVHEGALAIRKVTTLALSFDHRILDGEEGSKLLRDVGDMLEDPLTLLARS
ncbi:Dihydrolipoyllysine-residue acetyltransferase component of pyruvate dehydrogenase complex [Actinomadura rubteroloni]|uniref:Dihydrolipoamide acetyltransferase component of pyruvate dehydrogenase complex n=1 Tax=Actinomadura rubteroloni TaxID=1926885 RepID=A0A2P4ULJ4_9ACTN|nr:dihydrolipoamide acetyltransferase family protein [Actinomadura rubteroloni]POM25920.1 Dihydrolipoyllysine-residue acetyltransferase component of pyruvate dehydrogenase complex [Actinomadura rubteroloni]